MKSQISGKTSQFQRKNAFWHRWHCLCTQTKIFDFFFHFWTPLDAQSALGLPWKTEPSKTLKCLKIHWDFSPQIFNNMWSRRGHNCEICNLSHTHLLSSCIVTNNFEINANRQKHPSHLASMPKTLFGGAKRATQPARFPFGHFKNLFGVSRLSKVSSLVIPGLDALQTLIWRLAMSLWRQPGWLQLIFGNFGPGT